MIGPASRLRTDRCRFLLLVTALCAGLFWLAGHQLVTLIYHGNAGALFNPLITGQATRGLGLYHADFNRLFWTAGAVVLLPLLVCSLLPRRMRETIDRLPVTPLLLALLILAGATDMYLWWQSAARIPDRYLPGHATVLSGPAACRDQTCYELEIACPELAGTEKVMLRLGRPNTGVPARGTILFFSGWTGNYWWQWDNESDAADDGTADAADLRIRANHRMVFDAVHAAGFQTVDVKWERGWFIADEGKRENPPLLACRPATLVRWVYETLHEALPDRAFCATGHSNGASELAYLLSRYDMADILSLVIMEAGPNWARLDYACIEEAAHGELFDTLNGRSTNDLAFGYPNDGSGICARQRGAWRETFRRTSVAVDGEWTYRYPGTLIAFLYGTDDPTVTGRHGKYYRDWMKQAGTPLLESPGIEGGDHVPSGDPAGAAVMRDIFLEECRPR